MLVLAIQVLGHSRQYGTFLQWCSVCHPTAFLQQTELRISQLRHKLRSKFSFIFQRCVHRRILQSLVEERLFAVFLLVGIFLTYLSFPQFFQIMPGLSCTATTLVIQKVIGSREPTCPLKVALYNVVIDRKSTRPYNARVSCSRG